MLSPKPSDEFQPNLVCELLTYMGRSTTHFFALSQGSKRHISLNVNYKINFIDFYTKLCVFSHKKYTKNIKRISILLPGSCPRIGTLGHWGMPRGSKIYFFEHGHVAYQIDGNDEYSRM